MVEILNSLKSRYRTTPHTGCSNLGASSQKSPFSVRSINFRTEKKQIQRRFIWTHVTFFRLGIPKLRRSSSIDGQTVTPEASENLGKDSRRIQRSNMEIKNFRFEVLGKNEIFLIRKN